VFFLYSPLEFFLLDATVVSPSGTCLLLEEEVAFLAFTFSGFLGIPSKWISNYVFYGTGLIDLGNVVNYYVYLVGEVPPEDVEDLLAMLRGTAEAKYFFFSN
jgi:hypothetical protein